MRFYDEFDKSISVYLLIFDRDVSDKVTDNKIKDNHALVCKGEM